MWCISCMSLWRCLEDLTNTIKMEIQELIFFYLHENTNTIEVQFRLNVDSEEEIRIDLIDLNEASDFGYDLILEDYDLKGDEDDDEEFYWLESPSIDEDNLINFLNEYYVVSPEKLPKPELI
jgi:hypothetical protein